MSTINREQRQLLLEQRHSQFRAVLSYTETDDGGARLKGEIYITKDTVHSWRIVEHLLNDFTSHIMNVRFDGDTLQVRYLCPESSPTFCRVFDYIVELYSKKREGLLE